MLRGSLDTLNLTPYGYNIINLHKSMQFIIYTIQFIQIYTVKQLKNYTLTRQYVGEM